MCLHVGNWIWWCVSFKTGVFPKNILSSKSILYSNKQSNKIFECLKDNLSFILQNKIIFFGLLYLKHSRISLYIIESFLFLIFLTILSYDIFLLVQSGKNICEFEINAYWLNIPARYKLKYPPADVPVNKIFLY